ncbi:MAG TPA: hypothetical protein VFJ82_15785 [Longimicrobium sp.]|nr:hypothetical protein [Longimicrobium sp.]
MKILFDSMSSQVQVHDQTHTRLNTLLGAVSSAGYSRGDPWTASFSDYRKPLFQQLDGVDVLAILTHQWTSYPDLPPAIPPDVSFAFYDDDLKRIPEWVAAGHGLLLVSNHGAGPGEPPYWPVNDAVLAEKFDVTIVPAAFVGSGGSLAFPTVTGAPRPIVDGVREVVAHNCCGIGVTDATVIASIPSTARDGSGHGYSPDDYAFCVLKQWGDGSAIVAGNSGTAGDRGNRWPANGMIPAGNNLRFYLNCLGYLGGVRSPASVAAEVEATAAA